MKKTVSRVNKAMRETVDVEGLADKIFGKYLKFVETKARSPGPHINIPAQQKAKESTVDTKDRVEDPQEMKLDEHLGSVIDPSEESPG